MCQVIRKPSILVEKPVSNKTFLSHYGTKLPNAPASLSEIPEGQTAVMLMDNFDDIHVASEQFELEHLSQYEGKWFTVDSDELDRVL